MLRIIPRDGSLILRAFLGGGSRGFVRALTEHSALRLTYGRRFVNMAFVADLAVDVSSNPGDRRLVARMRSRIRASGVAHVA